MIYVFLYAGMTWLYAPSKSPSLIASSILVVDFELDEEFQVGGEENETRISCIIKFAMTCGT
jgi:hypothetical protein